MAKELCGKWMPRKLTYCARGAGHPPPCATPEAMQRQRERRAEREGTNPRITTLATRRRWRLAHKMKRYGLTQEQFDRLLEKQGYACAMCHEPFEEEQPIFIDHDHACCPDEKRSCGKCIRGLLCLSCNTSLGHIERKYDQARAYLDNPPCQTVIEIEQIA